MATWRDFKAYVKSSFDVSREQTDLMKLTLEAESGRVQDVYLSHKRLLKGREAWLVIESPIGKLDEIDLAKVLAEAGHWVCGGVVVLGHLVVYRHSVPLENLDANEFRRPLQIVIESADHLEQLISEEDVY